jgi:cytochrome c peroxidase
MKTRQVHYFFLFFYLLILVIISCKQSSLNDPDEDLTSIQYKPVAYDLELPDFAKSLEFPIPADNPLTIDGVELGRFLFYDPILSRDSTISCASCHRQELAFTDGRALAVGIDGRVGKRSSPSLANIGFANRGLFWDGRVMTLEEQALHPIEDPLEMDETLDRVVDKLRRHTIYPGMFRMAFGINNRQEIRPELIGKALAQFQRTFISFNSKFDRFNKGDISVDFSADELDGLILFDHDVTLAGIPDAECAHCHDMRLFGLNAYFHNGLISESEMDSNPGRYLVTGANFDKGKFRAVSLRNIALTGPYMHDGRLIDLDEVLAHYNSGGHLTFNRDINLNALQNIQLTGDHLRKLKAFLHTLTDTSFIENPKFSNPFK